MTDNRRSTEWFLKLEDEIRGPLTESEMRKAIRATNSDRLFVRQGESDWHPASTIRKKLDALSANGVYIRFKQVAEGPFTLKKAYELLQTVSTSGIRVRTGTDGKWISARKWIQAVDRIKQKKKQAALAAVAKLSDSVALDPNEVIAEVVSHSEKAKRERTPRLPNESDTIELHVEDTIVAPVEAEQVVEPIEVVSAVLVEENGTAESFAAAAATTARKSASQHPLGLVSKRVRHVPAAARPVSHQPVASHLQSGDPLAGIPTHSDLGKTGRSNRRSSNRHLKPVSGGNAKWIVIAGVSVAALIFVSVVAAIVVQSQLPNQDQAQEEYMVEQGIIDPFDSAMIPSEASDGSARSSGPPVAASGMVFRPTFHTTAGMVDAGTAFAATRPGSSEVFILTALHLFGEAGGLSRDINPVQLPNVWQALSLEDCHSGIVHSRLPMEPVRLENTRPLPEQSAQGDVAACRLTNSDEVSLTPFPIATRPPRPGDRVWLVAEVMGSRSLVHSAAVEGTEDGFLVYVFDRPIELRATSGAPIVNGNGEVVAVNAGGGEGLGRVFGVGTPTTKFVNRLGQ
ncbi:MAG: GYF domain-containing protein [Planctomycetota bacterium]